MWGEPEPMKALETGLEHSCTHPHPGVIALLQAEDQGKGDWGTLYQRADNHQTPLQ